MHQPTAPLFVEHHLDVFGDAVCWQCAVGGVNHFTLAVEVQQRHMRNVKTLLYRATLGLGDVGQAVVNSLKALERLRGRCFEPTAQAAAWVVDWHDRGGAVANHAVFVVMICD